jgi:serine/threonine protein kinase
MMPFGHNKKDYKKVFEQIVKADYRTNKEYNDCDNAKIKDLLDRLLLKNPRKRMQSTRRAEILKEFSTQLETLDLVKVYCQEANDNVPRPECKLDDAQDYDEFLKNNANPGKPTEGLKQCTKYIKTFNVSENVQKLLKTNLDL